MSKFVIECPKCHRYAEASGGLFGTGLFAKRTVKCSCGETINIQTEKLSSRKCPHCGNDVVFDQSKGDKAKCPVCHEPINTMAAQDKTVEFSCGQCGIRLRAAKGADKFTCPVCDHVNDVAERAAQEKIKHDGAGAATTAAVFPLVPVIWPESWLKSISAVACLNPKKRTRRHVPLVICQ